MKRSESASQTLISVMRLLTESSSILPFDVSCNSLYQHQLGSSQPNSILLDVERLSNPVYLRESCDSTNPLELFTPIANSDQATTNAKRSSTLIDVKPMDAKKARLDSSSSSTSPSSCVLHLRNLPKDVTDFEVAALAIPFGLIANMIITKKNSQALIEMDTLESAEIMLSYYKNVYPPRIRCQGPVEFRYSNYTSLTSTMDNQQTTKAMQEANKKFTSFQAESDGVPRTILHVQVERPVPNTDLGYMPFYQAFRRFGRILRVITFKKNDSRHAFLEFENSTEAHVAKLNMNGMPLFPQQGIVTNTFILRTEFSRQPSLEVHREDHSSRDFTKNPWSELDDSKEFLNGTGFNGLGKYPPIIGAQKEMDLLSEDRLASLEPACLSALANRLIKPLLKAASNIPGPQADLLRAQATSLGGLTALIRDNQHNMSNNSYWPHMNSFNQQQHHSLNDMQHESSNSPVVFISNLNTERVNPDLLFILFGIYGDVQRVKIIHNKKDTALVQFTDNNQAIRAINHLNGVKLFGKVMRCVLSKNHSITMPVYQNLQNLTPDADREFKNTCDYTGHRLHRFRYENSRNQQNICAPSKILHVANIPPSVSLENLQDTFERVTGLEVRNAKLLKTKVKMALLELENLDDAVSALVAMHDYPIEDSARLRVSFSKSNM